MMAIRPSYQWYPGDFRRDTAVQSCSFDARALWREMLDIMHDGEPYGHLTAGGVPIEPPELARMVGLEKRRLRPALAELERKNVLSRTPEGVIYSRRMVRDEDVRQRRAAGGKLGGNPALMDGGKDTPEVGDKVNLPANLPPTPSVCSLHPATAKATEPPPPPRRSAANAASKQANDLEWQQVKREYPARAGGQGWAKAEERFHRQRAKGATFEEILEGTRRYALYVRAAGKEGTEYVKTAETFFGPGKHWQEEFVVPPEEVDEEAAELARMQASLI